MIRRVQVILQGVSNLPEDRFVNTFHFNADDTVGATQDINAALRRFYLGATENGENAISGFMSDAQLADEVLVKHYMLHHAEPRTPVGEGIFNLVNETASPPLPTELAVCLSYQAPPISGQNQRRRRGRLYLGPFAQNSAVSEGGTPARPSPGLRTVIADAAARLLNEASPHVAWCIYSPTNLPNPVAASTAPEVSSGWVDNAWDVQRRRGVRSTARTTFIG